MSDYVKAPNYGGINDYVKYLKTEFKPEGTIIPGRFYTMNYKFSLDYKDDKLKFYDFMPLYYCFEKWDGGVVGMNFHHMPIQARTVWLDRVRNMSSQIDAMIPYIDFRNPRIYRIPGLNYPQVYKLLMKTKIAIRRYRYDRMYDVRAVPLQNVWEVLHFYSRTYFGCTIKDIDQRWLHYNPNPHTKKIKGS